MLSFVEDVGRHNAVDTLAGEMWLNGMRGDDKIFYTTGRLTSEMVIKVAQMGIPVLLSRSGVTQMGLELAQRFWHYHDCSRFRSSLSCVQWRRQNGV